MIASIAPAFTRQDAKPIAVPPAQPDSELPRPHLDYDVRRDVWFFAAEYHLEHEGHRLTIPKGFTLDLASIPRVLWWMISSFELGLIGPSAHDFLYQCRGEPGPSCDPTRIFSRKEADDFFMGVMKREGVPAARRRAAYSAVRLFGAHAWRKRR